MKKSSIFKSINDTTSDAVVMKSASGEARNTAAIFSGLPALPAGIADIVSLDENSELYTDIWFQFTIIISRIQFNISADKCDTMQLLLIIFIAFFIAVLFSLLGLGGAIIYTPLFYWSGLDLLTAIPMALFLNMITTSSSASTYLRQRIVDTGIALPVILASIPGAFIGSKLARIIDMKLLIILLSISILFAGIRILFFEIKGTSVISANKRAIVGAFAGFVISVVSSLVGIGGGTFIMPLLLFLGLGTKKAVGTSALIVAFISLFGFLSHMSQGGQHIDISIMIFVGIAAFAGAQAGSRFIFRKTSPRTIERMFALVLLLVGGNLLYGLF